jgi:glycosyltransferase involved in cell wall biosynthesis
MLPLNARRVRAPLIYSPANAAPLAWPRNVVVLHDTAVWRSPESFSRAYLALHRPLEAAAARRALRVVTVSEFSKRELVELLGLDPARIAVVPNGVGEEFTPEADPEPARREHGLHGPYVLTVATAAARKNLGLLQEVARKLGPHGIEVVWAGGGRRHFHGGDAPEGVRSIGYVRDAHLPGLYGGALAFALPSRYEGFGITCLEAMACGTPVVAANRSALPETCGDAAILIDPDDVESFCAAVEQAVHDPALRSRLRTAGLRRASTATWSRAAQATDALLTELAARGASGSTATA